MTTTPATRSRHLPEPVLPGIWQWSVWSEEKQLYFNGHACLVGETDLLLIDPPSAEPEVASALKALGRPMLILLTNGHHEREAQALRKALEIPLAMPMQDVPLLEDYPDLTFQDGDWLPGGWLVIQLADQKTPGECALYREADGVMILGDALIRPEGQTLRMLPADKYDDPALAKTGLLTLAHPERPVHALLLGDGESLLKDAGERLQAALKAMADHD
ncbi:MAG: hypothetical protein AB7P76_06925 [Candidatus Melainabacteria bacterium]